MQEQEDRENLVKYEPELLEDGENPETPVIVEEPAPVVGEQLLVADTEYAPEVEQPRSTIEANGDDLSSLFEVPKSTDPDIDTRDLFELDLVDDVQGGDLSDLVDVTEEDIMGEDWDKPKPPPKPRRVIRYQRTSRPYPTSLGGITQ